MKVTPNPDILWPLGPISGVILAPYHDTTIVRPVYREPTRSQCQILNQNAFRNADLYWQNLTTIQKQAWRDWRKWDKLHGYPWFMRINIPLARAGDPPMLEPPPYPPG